MSWFVRGRDLPRYREGNEGKTEPHQKTANFGVLIF